MTTAEHSEDQVRDALRNSITGLPVYQRLRCLPASKGSVILLSHRCVHWGAESPDTAQAPSIRFAFCCADRTFEPPILAENTPMPALDVRIALAAAQLAIYAKNLNLHTQDLTFYHRLFRSRASRFTPSFVAKVSDRLQWLNFIRKSLKKPTLISDSISVP